MAVPIEPPLPPPLQPPGPPPEKPRGRPSNAKRAALEAEKLQAERQAEEARRKEQTDDVVKLIAPVVAFASRSFLPEPKRLSEEEQKDISLAGSALLVKYVDLRGLEKYQEEIAFAAVVGKIALRRIDLEPAKGERDSRSGGTGQKLPTPSPAA